MVTWMWSSSLISILAVPQAFDIDHYTFTSLTISRTQNTSCTALPQAYKSAALTSAGAHQKAPIRHPMQLCDHKCLGSTTYNTSSNTIYWGASCRRHPQASVYENQGRAITASLVSFFTNYGVRFIARLICWTLHPRTCKDGESLMPDHIPCWITLSQHEAGSQQSNLIIWCPHPGTSHAMQVCTSVLNLRHWGQLHWSDPSQRTDKGNFRPQNSAGFAEGIKPKHDSQQALKVPRRWQCSESVP